VFGKALDGSGAENQTEAHRRQRPITQEGDSKRRSAKSGKQQCGEQDAGIKGRHTFFLQIDSLPAASASGPAHVEAFAAANAFATAVEPDADADENSENHEFSHVFSMRLFWVSTADIADGCAAMSAVFFQFIGTAALSQYDD
jgi:hypothetical protein